MVGCTFIAIGSERRKVGVSALITTWNEEKKFIVFPLFSLLFLSALSIRKLSILLHRAGAQKAATQENSNNKQNNRSMGYLIITDQNWQKLRDEILSLADCLTSVSAHCSITEIRAYCPSHRLGTSVIINVRTWRSCSLRRRIKLKSNRIWKQQEI